MVVAERALTAQDAAEFVHVEYEPLTPVTDARDALKTGAPQIWPEAPNNLAVDWPGPAADPDANAAEVERIFASAKYVARISEMNQRLCVASMEPRGATASYDAARDAYTLRTCSQSAGTMRENILGIMNWPKEKLRVITEDVGGAFGLKTSAYPEYMALLMAAKKLGRPVHWMSGRSEAFLSDNQARDTLFGSGAGARRQGQIPGAAHPQRRQYGRLSRRHRRQYPDAELHPLPARHVRHPKIDIGVQMRLHQHAADRALSRRRPAGIELRARARGRRSGARHRHRSGQAAAAQSDQKVGLSLQDPGRHHRSIPAISSRSSTRRWSLPITKTSSSAAARRKSAANIAGSASAACSNMPAARRSKARCWNFRATRRLQLRLNVQNTGQGHATVFSRLIGERLGIPPDKIPHRHGDSANELPGYASVGSRSGMTVSHSVVKAIDAILAKGKPIAATMLEAGEADIAYKNGEFEVVGTDRRVSLFEVAARAAAMKKRGEIAEDLDTKTVTETPQTFPNGVHIAEVEIDPDTGHMDVVVLCRGRRLRQSARSP